MLSPVPVAGVAGINSYIQYMQLCSVVKYQMLFHGLTLESVRIYPTALRQINLQMIFMLRALRSGATKCRLEQRLYLDIN
jgi:hypothetical protein